MQSILKKSGRPLAEMYANQEVAVRKTKKVEMIEFIQFYRYDNSYGISCIGKTEQGVAFQGGILDYYKDGNTFFFQFANDRALYDDVKEEPKKIYEELKTRHP